MKIESPILKQMSLESVFTFGKYKGKQLEDLIEDDPDYLYWLWENEVVEFDSEVVHLLTIEGIL